MEQQDLKAELKYALIMCGEQSVMISGEWRMPLWCAGNWDSPQQVSLDLEVWTGCHSVNCKVVLLKH